MKIEAIEQTVQSLEKRNKANEGRVEKIDVSLRCYDANIVVYLKYWIGYQKHGKLDE